MDSQTREEKLLGLDLVGSQDSQELFLLVTLPCSHDVDKTEKIRLQTDHVTLVRFAKEILVRLEPSLTDLLFQKLDRIADSLESLSGQAEKSSSKPPSKD